MNKQLLFSVLFLLFLSAANVLAQAAHKTAMKPAHKRVLERWLATKPDLRLALETDFDSQLLKDSREYRGTSFQPHYSFADFNGDGTEDFAVILMSKSNAKNRSVAVFNGPFKSNKRQLPAVYWNNFLESTDLIIYDKRTKGLMLGPDFSDNGYFVIPSKNKKRYILEHMLDDAGR